MVAQTVPLAERVKAPLPVAIRSIRQRLGMTRLQLAGLLDCPKNAVVYWELGRHTPSAKRLIKLLRLAQTPDEMAPISKALQAAGIDPALLALPPDTSQSAPVSTVQPA